MKTPWFNNHESGKVVCDDKMWCDQDKCPHAVPHSKDEHCCTLSLKGCRFVQFTKITCEEYKGGEE